MQAVRGGGLWMRVPHQHHHTRPARCSTVCGLGHQETDCQRAHPPVPERGGKHRAASLRPSSVPFASVLYQAANGLRVRDQSASVSPWVSRHRRFFLQDWCGDREGGTPLGASPGDRVRP